MDLVPGPRYVGKAIAKEKQEIVYHEEHINSAVALHFLFSRFISFRVSSRSIAFFSPTTPA